MINPAIFTLNLILAVSNLAPGQQPNQNQVEAQKAAEPNVQFLITKMEGYERYLSDPKFQLSAQRRA